MKKLIPLITLILFLPVITGCSEETKTYDTFLDTFLITDMRVDGISIPAVFNPAKGTMTPLCTDPLCAHTEKAGCPFAGYNTIWEPHYHNGSIWFLSMVTFGKLDDFAVMRYDMDTAKVTELIRMEELREYIPDTVNQDNSQSFGFRDGYFRYTIHAADRTSAFRLRVVLDSGEVEVLANEYHQPFAQYKKQHLAYTEELDYTGVSYGIHLTDADGNVKETILPDKRIDIAFDDLLDDGKLLYVTAVQREDGTYDWDWMTVWMYDMETGEDSAIIENFPSSYIAAAGDYIYYSRYVDDPPKMGYDLNHNEDKYNLSGGILFRTNIYTGEESVAFEMPDYVLRGVEIDRVGQYIVISYENTDYENYTEESTHYGIWYQYDKENGRIVYDTETGTTAVYPDAST
ncbi:MAG: hypothetical protein IKI93_08880 [Clostridia bacterium]|nr:hypothetical protein [Clostridia bacterium]